MEKSRTLEILRSLADGIDPATGEPFAVGSVYQHPDTVRSLYSAIRLLEVDPAPIPAASSTALPNPLRRNSGRPWSIEEDKKLGDAYNNGRTVGELADIHERSKWAVEARLARLGMVPEPRSMNR